MFDPSLLFKYSPAGSGDSNIISYATLNNPPIEKRIAAIGIPQIGALMATVRIAMIGTIKNVNRKKKRPCLRPRVLADGKK